MSSDLLSLFCQICQFTFANYDDLSTHSCTQIKQEKQDTKEKVESDENQVNIFKPAMQLVEIKMEESDSEENKPLRNFENIDENAPLKSMKKTKKKKSLQLSNDDLVDENYSDLDLTEEFLSTILRYVDDLCNYINSGDPNLERTMEINQNLNNSVKIYRVQLQTKKKIMKKVKKEKKEKIKSVKQTKKMLNKDTIDNHDPLLYSYLKYNSEKNVFECSICNKTTKEKRNLLRHIKLIHLGEIKSNEDQKSNVEDDLGDSMVDSMADSMADHSGAF